MTERHVSQEKITANKGLSLIWGSLFIGECVPSPQSLTRIPKSPHRIGSLLNRQLYASDVSFLDLKDGPLIHLAIEKIRNLSEESRLLLKILINSSKANSRTLLSIRFLSKKSFLSSRTIHRYLKMFIKMGFLKVYSRYHATNLYVVSSVLKNPNFNIILNSFSQNTPKRPPTIKAAGYIYKDINKVNLETTKTILSKQYLKPSNLKRKKHGKKNSKKLILNSFGTVEGFYCTDILQTYTINTHKLFKNHQLPITAHQNHNLLFTQNYKKLISLTPAQRHFLEIQKKYKAGKLKKSDTLKIRRNS